MKSPTVLLLLFSGLFTLTSAELYFQRIPNFHESAKRALKVRSLKKGDSSIPLEFNGKKYPDTWAFWCIDRGSSPADFKMSPTYFQPSGAERGMMRTAKMSCFSDFNFGWLRNNGEGTGIAFSFLNPSKETLEMELDGSLRLYVKPTPNCRMYVYTKTAEGKIKEITSSRMPDAIITMFSKNNKPYYYLRLSAELKLQPGARLFFAFYDADILKNKGQKTLMFYCLNEGHGKRQLIPNFILRSRIR